MHHDNPQLYIITGLSGAGKSTALRVFEDMGYFAVDGLPAAVAPKVAEIMHSKPMQHFPGMAISLDTRTENFLDDFQGTLATLKNLGFQPHLIFLEADNRALFQRYAATRRPHPLEARQPGLESAIITEQKLLAPLRILADQIIDSTNYSIHDLRRRLQKDILPGSKNSLKVKVLSFGFKRGLPPDADFVFDLRFLANPYFVENLRPLSGLDKAVAEYVFATPEAREFKDKLLNLLLFGLQCMQDEGRYRVTIALGCTGGRHRSVAMAASITKALQAAGFSTTLEHRDMEREGSNGG